MPAMPRKGEVGGRAGEAISMANPHVESSLKSLGPRPAARRLFQEARFNNSRSLQNKPHKGNQLCAGPTVRAFGSQRESVFFFFFLLLSS